MNRRSFLLGLIAAPAIVAASNIMPVRLPSILRAPLRVIYVDANYTVFGPRLGSLASPFCSIQAAVDALRSLDLHGDQTIIQLAIGFFQNKLDGPLANPLLSDAALFRA